MHSFRSIACGVAAAQEGARVSIGLSHDGGCCRIHLEGAIDISSAAELKAALVRALETAQELDVSFAAATELDVTGVQLLWAAERAAKQRGLGFSIAEPPEPICRLLTTAGLRTLAIFSCAASG
jgi:anti-anti-sigma factor